MEKIYAEDKTFEKIDFTKNKLTATDYENCIFTECNFSGVNLSNITFSECQFKECNLSLVNITQTGLREIRFTDCKLLGLHFERCNEFLFSVSFERCTLNLSSFFKMKMKKTIFKKCILQETDFGETDLSLSRFDDCDLQGALFENTNLEKADLRSAYNYTIDPEKNHLTRARFSLSGLPGLLERYKLEIE